MSLSAEDHSVRLARHAAHVVLSAWQLDYMKETAVLIVSELVTNAVRYAQGKIGLRLILEGGLVCEVQDGSAALPRIRHPGVEDERGRGLQVVSQIAQRWGARRTPSGKVVWCEQALPHG